jgi:hypothetical protein
LSLPLPKSVTKDAEPGEPSGAVCSAFGAARCLVYRFTVMNEVLRGPCTII